MSITAFEKQCPAITDVAKHHTAISFSANLKQNRKYFRNDGGSMPSFTEMMDDVTMPAVQEHIFTKRLFVDIFSDRIRRIHDAVKEPVQTKNL